MNDTNGKVKPFGIKDKLGYMFGDFGNDFTFLLSAMFLLEILHRRYGCFSSTCRTYDDGSKIR